MTFDIGTADGTAKDGDTLGEDTLERIRTAAEEKLGELRLARRRRKASLPGGPSRPPTTPKGRAGEDEAARYLEERGLSIVARNVRAGGGEIDLVASDEGRVVFVEVKWRRDSSRGTPADAVTPAKRRKILSAARAWLAENPSGAASLSWDPTDVYCRYYYNYANPLTGRFLTYRLYWTADSLRQTVVDGGVERDLFATPFAIDSVSDEFREPFYFVINLAVGGAFTDAQVLGGGGLPVTIYRPAIVVGDSRTGATQKYDGPYFMIRWLLRQPLVAVLPVVGKPSATRVNLVPRDFVVEAMAYLSGLDASAGKVYHLADPDPLTVSELVDLIGHATRRKIVRVPLPRSAAKFLIDRVPGIYWLMQIPSPAIDYFVHPTLYTCASTLAELDGSGLKVPPLPTYIDRLVDFVRCHPSIGSSPMA